MLDLNDLIEAELLLLLLHIIVYPLLRAITFDASVIGAWSRLESDGRWACTHLIIRNTNESIQGPSQVWLNATPIASSLGFTY